MNKEYLEALERLYCSGNLQLNYVLSNKYKQDYELLEKALQRLESIDNSNPSEALKCFNHFEKWYSKICYRVVTSFQLDTDLSIIKQALVKAQEQEKVLSVIKEKDVDIYILRNCKTVDEYNSKIVHIIDEARELINEEFNLLMRYLNND